MDSSRFWAVTMMSSMAVAEGSVCGSAVWASAGAAAINRAAVETVIARRARIQADEAMKSLPMRAIPQQRVMCVSSRLIFPRGGAGPPAVAATSHYSRTCQYLLTAMLMKPVLLTFYLH